MRENYFLEFKAQQPLNMAVVVLISKRSKKDLKRPELLPL
jgi:hypothetical protein